MHNGHFCQLLNHTAVDLSTLLLYNYRPHCIAAITIHKDMIEFCSEEYLEENRTTIYIIPF